MPRWILYTNHRGELAWRLVRPERYRFGTEPPWHPEPQLLLEAFDFSKCAERTFAVCNIHIGPERGYIDGTRVES